MDYRSEWVQVTQDYLDELYAEIAGLRLRQAELEVAEENQDRRPQNAVKHREAA